MRKLAEHGIVFKKHWHQLIKNTFSKRVLHNVIVFDVQKQRSNFHEK